MKTGIFHRTLMAVLFFIYLNNLVAQPINQRFQEENGSWLLLGRVNEEALMQKEFENWYLPAKEAAKKAYTSLDSLSGFTDVVDSVVVFFGTWCGDSKRELPIFMSLMESIPFPMKKINLIAVDHGAYTYKKSPFNEQEGMGVHRVPTFIFFTNEKKEIGRIVESPNYGWLEDLYRIQRGLDYKSTYAAVSFLQEIMSQYKLSSLQRDRPSLLDTLKTMVTYPGELNTFARVLSSSYEGLAAEWVYEVNHIIFPEYWPTSYYLIHLKIQVGKFEEAKKLLQESIFPEEARAYQEWLSSEIRRIDQLN